MSTEAAIQALEAAILDAEQSTLLSLVGQLGRVQALIVARVAALSHLGTGAMRRAMPDSDEGHE